MYEVSSGGCARSLDRWVRGERAASTPLDAGHPGDYGVDMTRSRIAPPTRAQAAWPTRPWTTFMATLAATLVAALLGLGLAAGPAAAQRPPPDGEWLTFSTEHFRVTYQAGLDELARHAAAVAERTHAALRDELVRAPRGPIELVVTDHVDFSNGYATPFASNRVVVFARPPVVMPSLAFTRDWLELVVAHEIVHIFHLDHAGPVGRGVRGVLGRVPFLWPVFPVLGTPVWNLEGLATYYESRLTGGGRVHGSYHDMVIRTAALEAEIPRLRHVSAPSPVWPGGERSYIYGAALMDWIADQYGVEAHAELVEATARSWLPTFFFFDRVARRPLGRSFSDIYADWRAAAVDSARAHRDRLDAEGLTLTEVVVGRGAYAVAPRVSPDGRWLSYAGDDHRSDAATRLVDLATGEARSLARRNQFGWILGPASWLPDGAALVAAQLEYHGRFRLFSDLWRVGMDGSERRLTRGERLAQPDVAPDGRRVAAVQNHRGAIRLVEYDLDSGGIRVLADAAPGEAFSGPRWSPDGTSIAVTRYASGSVDVVVVDHATGAVRAITHDDALDSTPAWSPDGRWIIFWSDRTGVPNLFAAPAGDTGRADGPGASLLQVTNLVGGALDPEVSPDGRTIYFASYHYDGWRLERIPFDPDTWRAPQPTLMEFQPALLAAPQPPSARQAAHGPASRTDDAAVRAAATAPARSYSALPTVRPYFWGPTYQVVGNTASDQWARFPGLYTMGWDVLERHSWTGTLAADPRGGRVASGLTWTWSGLGNPDLHLRMSRGWVGAGYIELPDESREAVLRRDDRVDLDAVVWLRQWRQNAWVGVRGGMEWQEYHTFQLGDEALAEAGIRLRDLPAIASVVVRPGFSNVRQYPYSISRQDGITTSLSAGRWWNVQDGRVAYDQILGSLAGYRGYRLWGFADHVSALRVAGLRRTGPDARTVEIGGVPGSLPMVVPGIPTTGSFLPVRGFRTGDRFGTHAWTASAEYRFPLHMRGAATSVLGFSLTSAAGSVFADAGSAWCTAAERDADRFHTCPAAADPPLASVGAELSLTIGVLDSTPVVVRYGLAVPLRGPADRSVVFHMGLGPSF
jgi:Tol biopolymer transport system component